MLVGSFHEDLREDPRFWMHVFPILKKTSVTHANYFHTNFPPTLIELFSIGLFRVVTNEPIEFGK